MQFRPHLDLDEGIQPLEPMTSTAGLHYRNNIFRFIPLNIWPLLLLGSNLDWPVLRMECASWNRWSVTVPSGDTIESFIFSIPIILSPVPMLFTLHPDRVAVLEENGASPKKWGINSKHSHCQTLVEEFPLALVMDPTAHISSDPEDFFNNVLLFVVREHDVPSSSSGGVVPTEMHIFQVENQQHIFYIHQIWSVHWSVGPRSGRGFASLHAWPFPQSSAWQKRRWPFK